MTLGKKLSNYRKVSDMTQQQLGDYLNVSAQAISKWENDLAEPDLNTLKALAALYKVSLDDLLEVDRDGIVSPAQPIDTEAVAASVSQTIAAQMKANAAPIGYCKVCGIAVTEENLGDREPVILCTKCKEEKERNEAAAKAKAEREAARAKSDREKKIADCKFRRRRYLTFSLIVAAIPALALMIYSLVSLFSGAQEFQAATIPSILITTYVVYAFFFCLFFEDCAVREVMYFFFEKTISWPGLIFTFDLDGILWLIGMKLLFWFLGLVFGILMDILGIAIGMLIAPFVAPYVLTKHVHKTRTAKFSSYDLDDPTFWEDDYDCDD